MSQFTWREARLKPEFAHVYPALEAGKWEPAGVLADKVVAWLLRFPGEPGRHSGPALMSG